MAPSVIPAVQLHEGNQGYCLELVVGSVTAVVAVRDSSSRCRRVVDGVHRRIHNQPLVHFSPTPTGCALPTGAETELG